MAEVETPYREVAEHGELGVVGGVFGDGGDPAAWRPGLGGAASRRSSARGGLVAWHSPAAGVGDANIFEGHVFDAMAGQASDDCGEVAMFEGQRGAFVWIAFVRFAGGDLHIDISNVYIF